MASGVARPSVQEPKIIHDSLQLVSFHVAAGEAFGTDIYRSIVLGVSFLYHLVWFSLIGPSVSLVCSQTLLRCLYHPLQGLPL